MNYNIQHLPPEKWRGYQLKFQYTTAHYYDATVTVSPSAFGVQFVLKPFDTTQNKSFDATLYPEYWQNAEAYGIFDGENLAAVIEIWHEEWSNRLRVTELWVDAPFRRQGMGKALMNFAKLRAKEMGSRLVMLETQSCNAPAIAFYMEQGFSFIGFDSTCYTNHDIENREVRVEMGILVD
jgi:ribosomal protein S18 acetylase RimI-like enzyme